MSKRKNGRFIGKQGNTVTYMLNGEEVQRSMGQRTKPLTPGQIVNCEKMSMINILQQPVREFLKIGFALQGKVKKTTARNMATSYNKKNAIKGTYPELAIDFDKVLFSQGDLPVNTEAMVELKENGLAFSWDPLLLKKGMKKNDSVLMLAYCEEMGSAFFEINGNRRSTGADFLELTAYHEPVTLEVYVAFVSADRKSISNSVHVGQVKF